MRALLVLPVLAAMACTPMVQTTSGAAYVAASAEIDPEIAEIAGAEPTLRFPARLGVARLDGGTDPTRYRSMCLATIPTHQADMLLRFAGAHGQFGSFIPVSPVLAELAPARRGTDGTARPRSLFDTVRAAAARQHLDAVIIYELSGTAGPFGRVALGDPWLSPIAASGPGRVRASALMLDVRTGYPYGTATVEVDLSRLRAGTGEGRPADRLRRAAEQQALEALLPQVSQMLVQLAAEL